MLILLLALLLTSPSQARWVKFDAFRLQPVDEAERDKDFFQFRYKLTRALETRDLKALLPLLSPEIKGKVDQSGSLQEFLREWKLDGENMRDSDIWNKLRDTVRLGGSFENGEFRAPYMYARWPSRYPHLDFYAVLSKNTPVHKRPDENSSVLETLTQELVGRFDELPNGPGWRAVRTASGVTGYISGDQTRSPLDYHAIFKKVNGSWKLAMFATGDWEAYERLE